MTFPVESTVKLGPKAESRPMYAPVRGAVPLDLEPTESRTVVAPVPEGIMVPSGGTAAESDGAGPMLSCAVAESVNALGDTVESPLPCAPSWPFGAQAASATTAVNIVIDRSIRIPSE